MRLDEAEIRSIMGDNVVSDGKQTQKRSALRCAAEKILDANVQHAGDLAQADPAAVKRAYTSVPGLGWVTIEYFLMLLGQPGIKADTMITRFVNAALREENLPTVNARGAHEILKTVYAETDAARDLGLTGFDHTIWSWQRKQ